MRWAKPVMHRRTGFALHAVVIGESMTPLRFAQFLTRCRCAMLTTSSPVTLASRRHCSGAREIGSGLLARLVRQRDAPCGRQDGCLFECYYSRRFRHGTFRLQSLGQLQLCHALWRGPQSIRSRGERNAPEDFRGRTLSGALGPALSVDREGDEGDDEGDYALPIWAGVIPVMVQSLALEPDPRNIDGVLPPAHITEFTFG